MIAICVLFIHGVVAAQDTVKRLEGEYMATYTFANSNGSGEFKDKGKVVYYLSPCKKGKASVTYDVYPISRVDCATGEEVDLSGKFKGALFMEPYWPRMSVCGAQEPDTTIVEGDKRVEVFDFTQNLTQDDKKAMKVVGLDTDINNWIITSVYDQSAGKSRIISLQLELSIVLKGVQYRRVFKAPSTDCTYNVYVTFGSNATEALTPKEAKAMRKREKEAYRKNRE